MTFLSRLGLRSGARLFAIFVTPAFLISGCATAADGSDAPRIVAIGDLHGDYEAYENLLRKSGLISKRGKWAGGKTIFVQTGDIADRGPDSKKIIEHLQKLEKQAARKGGDVITLVGNHEAMNVTGDLRYVHPGEYEAFTTRDSEKLRDRIYELNQEAIETAYLERDATLSSEAIKAAWESKTPLGMIEHQQAWRPEGEIGAWVVSNPAVAIVGNTLFVHGGISPAYATVTVDSINMQVAEALKTRSVDPESIINRDDSPLWYRGLISRPEETQADAQPEMPPSAAPDLPAETAAPAISLEEEVDAILSAFNVDRIVVGHTPSLTGVTALHGGKVIQIDTGIADYYGGAQSYLEIKDGVLYGHNNGAVQTLTVEGED